MKIAKTLVLALLAGAVLAPVAAASSHGEAPFVKKNPKVDSTDFYMFRSYEPGREGYVTIVANYYPLQDPYGGPNFFTLDPEAIYQIHVDNNGDAREDLTFSFRFAIENRNVSLNVGGVSVPIALVNAGPIGPTAADNAGLNVVETYSAFVVRGDRYTGPAQPVRNLADNASIFRKPADNIGEKSIPNYENYARTHIYDIKLPGSSLTGRMFVGQRKDPFVVNLGEFFDLLNYNPLGPGNDRPNIIGDKNVTSIVLELPIAYLTNGVDPVIGAWTTCSLPRARVLTTNPTFNKPASEQGAWTQVSRLGMPLVNEVVIGLKDKDKFGANPPSGDAQFLTYVTNPTPPALVQILYGVTPPTLPRNDLVAVFLTGVDGLNKPAGVTPGEMMRLNTAIAAKPKGAQSRFGVLGGDLAGFPNGRRPGDDVVDIELRALEGALYPDAGVPGGNAPFGNLPFTDGAYIDDGMFDNFFPYIISPLPGNR